MSHGPRIELQTTTVNGSLSIHGFAARALQLQQAQLFDQLNHAQKVQARAQRAQQAREAQRLQLFQRYNEAGQPQPVQNGRAPISHSSLTHSSLDEEEGGLSTAARQKLREQRRQERQRVWNQEQIQEQKRIKTERQRHQIEQQQTQTEQQKTEIEQQQSQLEQDQTHSEKQQTQSEQQESQTQHGQKQPTQQQEHPEQQRHQCSYHLDLSKHRDPLQLPWDLYIQRYGFTSIWEAELGSEQERYGKIVAHLMAQDLLLSQQEAEIVEQRAFWTTFPGRRSLRSPDYLSDSLKIINDAALMVEKSWATKSCNGLNHAKFSTDDKSGQRSYLYSQVQHHDDMTQSTSEILVTNSLSFTRYYLGHREGDFIFRYCPSNVSAGGAFVGSGLSIARAGFLFCGQVPRPQQHYLLRLQVVKCALIRAIASIIGFRCESHSRLPCFLVRVCRRAADVPHEDLAKLDNSWRGQFPACKPVHSYVLSLMLSSPYVGEFAHLLEVDIDRETSLSLKNELGPLIRIVETGTRLKLDAIAKSYSTHLEARAYQQLFSGESPANLLVFKDDFVEDIHAFYKQSHYHSDPYYPANRYNRVDVTDALELSLKLRDPDWHKDNEDGARKQSAESNSDSELSEPPHEDDEEENNEEDNDQETQLDGDDENEEDDPSYFEDN
ncbi:hypothetical protein EDB81DRAFT_951163 [Dactylonectria macrodidyma]|uniref:Uncharacterized protein n=1 Tax=Dactylonectria macrodidyma TaxID=307937 RepID=A0A9P9INX8_9HYPO|nr:hypothetical protein EDB81DRAFT_951163 [Dactylonectria macrodidyma]